MGFEKSVLDDIKILVVEDDDSTRSILVDAFKCKFSNIFEASCGEDGIRIYDKHSPDIIISDIVMPGINGVELASYIKSNCKDKIVILTSAYSDYDSLIGAIKSGVNDFISKPLSFDDLLNKVEFHAQNILSKELLLSTNNLLEEYKDIVDKTSIISKTDKRGVITYANEAFCEISGYSLDELIGKKHNIVKHSSMSDEVFKDLWKTISNKKIWRGVVKNRKKDGTCYIVESTIKPILNRAGEIIEYIALRNDITEKEMYKELLENQLTNKESTLDKKIEFIKQYEKAIDASTIHFRTSPEGKITYANDGFYDFVDRDPLEIKNSSISNILKLEYVDHKEDRGSWSERATISRDDRNRVLSLTVAPIYEDGKVCELLNIGFEITELLELQNEIVQTQKEFLLRLGELSEKRSEETGYHVQRVALYSEALAIKAGLEKRAVDMLKMAAPMHDIGKIGIPDSILNKPGKLDKDEYEIMKTHSWIGYELFCDSKKEILKTAATIAHEHHERWDGLGYPRGLKGEEIDIFGRIVGIADVFDALSHDRVYKSAWEHKRVMEFFKENSGVMFDPKLCEMFFEIMPKILEIKEKFGG